MVLVVKNLPAMQETQVQFLGWDAPLGRDRLPTPVFLGFPGGSVVKNQPASAVDHIQSLDQEDTLEKEMATHSSILAWRIPWREESGGLHSMGLQRDTAE